MSFEGYIHTAVVCDSCKAEGPEVRSCGEMVITLKEAVMRWNQRA